MNHIVKRTNSLPIFDDFFDDFFARPLNRGPQQCMRTDIQEVDNGFQLDIDVPGYGKDDIKISLDNGYLTVEATKEEEKEESKGHYLRRERFLGSAARSFYVGEDIAQGDIKATYELGILKLFIPKQGTNVKAKQYISID
ncbi:MAG: Hsp20/alpha crystallin family protein [Candidatus Izemoplasmatales bacterium]|nr:Hsp20/alpha crystallin family protein [Candidatus Izemoplasmatales bacterium]